MEPSRPIDPCRFIKFLGDSLKILDIQINREGISYKRHYLHSKGIDPPAGEVQPELVNCRPRKLVYPPQQRDGIRFKRDHQCGKDKNKNDLLEPDVEALYSKRCH